MNIQVQTVEIAGQRIALLPESDYLKLLDQAGKRTPELSLPPLPKRLPSGNYPAVEYARTSIAREIIRTRRRLGLSQADLARRARVEPAVLCRIEKAQVNPRIRTIDQIDAALKAAEKEALSGNKRMACM